MNTCNFLSSVDYDDEITTPEPPNLGYDLEVKIVNLGENYQVPKQNTAEFKELSNLIKNSFKNVFNKVPGYKDVIIENIIP